MRSVYVLDPGPLTLVQDRGRPGLAHLGVPRAGALDHVSADRANRLVGNEQDAAVLEVLFGPFGFQVRAAMAVAVTGAPCAVTVNDRPAAWGEALSLAADDVVRLASFHAAGARAYVAVSGGLAVDPVLGSRSTDTLAWVGPPRIEAGVELLVGAATGEPSSGGPVATARQDVELRYVAGPRDDWFETGPSTPYLVEPDSNRVGLRLRGEPLRRRRPGELPSEAIVLGAVQVPPSGQPLVFLNDHPTTGGYPVIGVVVPEDLHLCAQLVPGATVRFRRLPGT